MLITEDEEISKIENIDSYINSLSPEDISNKLIAFSKLCEEKMHEMQDLFNSINQKEEKINKLTLSSIIKDNPPPQIEEPKNDEILRREHNQKLKELEKEFQENLEKEIENLEEKYQKETEVIIDEHKKNVKHLQEEIEQMKYEIDYANENPDKFISNSEHQERVQQIINSHKEEIDKYDKEIEDIEKKIKETYPDKINMNNQFIKNNKKCKPPKIDINSVQDEKFQEQLDNYLNYLKQLKEKEQNGLITLLSSIDDGNDDDKSYKESIIINRTDNSEYESNENDYDIGEHESKNINFPRAVVYQPNKIK